MESNDISRPPIAFMGNTVSQSTHAATLDNQARIDAEIAQPSCDHNTVEDLNYTPTYAEQHFNRPPSYAAGPSHLQSRASRAANEIRDWCPVNDENGMERALCTAVHP